VDAEILAVTGERRALQATLRAPMLVRLAGIEPTISPARR
jgi:hypothetical protein